MIVVVPNRSEAAVQALIGGDRKIFVEREAVAGLFVLAERECGAEAGEVGPDEGLFQYEVDVAGVGAAALHG